MAEKNNNPAKPNSSLASQPPIEKIDRLASQTSPTEDRMINFQNGVTCIHNICKMFLLSCCIYSYVTRNLPISYVEDSTGLHGNTGRLTEVSETITRFECCPEGEGGRGVTQCIKLKHLHTVVDKQYKVYIKHTYRKL